jgi:MoaA/NifB/PqqE/SkfB family radical SAM enzyme
MPDCKNLVPLEHVVVQVSNTCFFRCKMCSIWKLTTDHKIDISKYSSFFSDIKEFSGPNTVVVFTGGEAITCPEIYDLIHIASSNGFITNLNTNGWLLTKKVIKKLFDAGLSRIMISLDGLHNVHDNIRGIPGSFRKAVQGAKATQEYYQSKGGKIEITTICVISNYNVDDVIKLVDFVEDCSAFDFMHIQAVAAPFGEEHIQNDKILDERSGKMIPWFVHKDFSDLWPKDISKLSRMYSDLIKKKQEGSKLVVNEANLRMQYLYFVFPGIRLRNITCTAYKDIQVNLKGEVYHCQPKNELIGNINNASFSEFFRGEIACTSRKNIKECNINCHQLLNCGDPIGKMLFEKKIL